MLSSSSDFTEDERKHLEFIQDVIARLSNSSARIKGWGVTVAIATYGYAATQHEPTVALLGLAAAVFFGLLDTNYLREERLFVKLYEQALTRSITAYSMKKDVFKPEVPRSSVIFSWSIVGFYGPLLVIGLLTLAWSSGNFECSD
ncbi:hypothetical protein [Nesterenkonia jeotgali]|uniref:Uncharacterized protein n=1 Tax=Nesterenkonia jeotgali TaxID=317018 RepID=A0A839FUS9_9MICC|nr:hypothetical protein [Nesterenkonia jeotgali]MBA8922331.1 hypothetical protein [Nesterenkonia jeotgali]